MEVAVDIHGLEKVIWVKPGGWSVAGEVVVVGLEVM